MKYLHNFFVVFSIIFFFNCKNTKPIAILNVSPPTIPINGQFSDNSEGRHFVIVELQEGNIGKINRIRNMQNDFPVSIDGRVFLTSYPEIKVGSCDGYGPLVVIRQFEDREKANEFIRILSRLDILNERESPIPISEKNFHLLQNCTVNSYIKYHNRTFSEVD